MLITDYRVTGHTDGGAEIRVGASSASQPSVVAVMLDRLDVQDGQTVLEIGAGTGYNAALLCRRLGADRVTSVDINPTLVEQASTRLAQAGYRPRLEAVDGSTALPGNARFDRIIATCSVNAVPPAWIEQLAPGGRLVVPLAGARSGALAVLGRTSDDTVQGAIDKFCVYFMPLRDSVDSPFRDGRPPPEAIEARGEPHRGATEIDPRLLADPDFLLWVELHLRHAQISILTEDTTELHVWTPRGLAVVPTTSRQEDPPRWTVRQHGDQRPWDTVEVAYRSWQEHGRPSRERLGVTATADPTRQRVWLDEPRSPCSWPLPL